MTAPKLDRSNPDNARHVHIELLALDLGACTRCTGTLSSIEAALALAAPALSAANVHVSVNARIIASEAQAKHERFVTSPTIRVNGVDIAPDILETHCDSCTSLCGCEDGTLCREWQFAGERHDEAPVGLVLQAIMRAAFVDRPLQPPHVSGSTDDEVPDNLKKFFAAADAGAAFRSSSSDMDDMEAATIGPLVMPQDPAPSSCCGPSKQATCCRPSDKASCCGSVAAPDCGCQ